MSAAVIRILLATALALANARVCAASGAEPVDTELYSTCGADGCLSLVQRGVHLNIAQEKRDVHTATKVAQEQRVEDEAMESYKKRVWLACRGPQFGTRSADEAESHIDRVNVMQCTTELTFEQLCCAPFETGLNFHRPVMMDLKDGQDKPAMNQSEALLQAGSETGIIICTQEAAAAKIAQAKGASAAKADMLCMPQEFSAAEIAGATGTGLKPGEVVLNARIDFLIQQGIPGSAIPTCVGSGVTCPSGKPPASAGKDALDSLGLAQMAGSARGRKARGTSRGGRASLSTTGSFTLSAGTGGDK